MKRGLVSVLLAGAALSSGCAVVPAYGPPGVYAPPATIYVGPPRPHYYGHPGYRPYPHYRGYGRGYYGHRW